MRAKNNIFGDQQADGSVKLHDLNIKYRTKLKGTKEGLRRNKHSTEQKLWLAKQGFRSVTSSNVSGLKVIGDDLYIRFLNASIYVYPGSADLYDLIFDSNSKGHAVWVYLRRPKKPYRKVGTLPFPQDLRSDIDIENMALTDDDIFDDINKEFLQSLFSNMVDAVILSETQIRNGIEYLLISFQGKVLYMPLELVQNSRH